MAPGWSWRTTSTCLRSAPHSPSRSRSGWAQLEDQRAQLVERAARRFLHLGDLARAARGLVAIAVEERPGGLGGEDQAEQLLAHGVVELEREPVCARRGSTARGCAHTGARW